MAGKFSIAYDVVRVEERSIVEAAGRKGAEVKLVDCKDRFFDLAEDLNGTFGGPVLQRCVSYYRNIHLTGLFEMKGLKVVNGFDEALICGNKLLCSLALMKAGIKTPRTMFSSSLEGALASLEKLGYPAVLKPTVGSWGKLMALMKDRQSAEEILEHREQMHPSYQVYYVQENVKRPPRDIRSFVVGDRVVAAIYREAAAGEWRTNTARGGKAVNCPVTSELEEISLRAVKAVGEGVFGVDCMETDDGLLVHEVNSTTEFRNSVPATGVDIPGAIVDYLVELSRHI